MIYQKFQPCTQLQPFVECYYIWQSEGDPVRDLVIESPPNGFCSMVFNLGSAYYLQNKKYPKLPVPKEFMAGQSIYSYRLFLDGDISICGIVFKPAGLASLFELPVYEFTEERIDLREFFSAPTVDGLVSQLAGSAGPKGKASLLESFVLRQFELKRPVPDFIDIAANTIVNSNGMLHLNELMENIYMSRRNFERKFFKKVGLSPKYYARIRRIAYLLNLIAGKKKADWSKVIADCEFYDQSHFIRDFTEFTGRTPQQYLEGNDELANLVEKPRSQALS